MNHYSDLVGFECVFLEDSWVTHIIASPRRMDITLDVVLREEHPLYKAPKENEQHCYKQGVITFTPIESIHWGDQVIRPAVDASGELDYGSIDTFTYTCDRYELNGDFGFLHINSTSPPTISFKA